MRNEPARLSAAASPLLDSAMNTELIMLSSASSTMPPMVRPLRKMIESLLFIGRFSHRRPVRHGLNMPRHPNIPRVIVDTSTA